MNIFILYNKKMNFNPDIHQIVFQIGPFAKFHPDLLCSSYSCYSHAEDSFDSSRDEFSHPQYDPPEYYDYDKEYYDDTGRGHCHNGDSILIRYRFTVYVVKGLKLNETPYYCKLDKRFLHTKELSNIERHELEALNDYDFFDHIETITTFCEFTVGDISQQDRIAKESFISEMRLYNIFYINDPVIPDDKIMKGSADNGIDFIDYTDALHIVVRAYSGSRKKIYKGIIDFIKKMNKKYADRNRLKEKQERLVERDKKRARIMK